MKQCNLRFIADGFNTVQKSFSYEEALSAALPLFEATNTGTSLGLYLRLKHSPSEYLDFNINPDDYLNAETFKRDYACSKLFSKAEFIPAGRNTRREAEVSFIAAERKCMETNARIWDNGTVRSSVVSNVIYIAIRKISKILGTAPTLSALPIRFGPGNNVGLSKNTSIYDKINAVPTVTSSLLATHPQPLAGFPSWASRHSVEVVPTPAFSPLGHMCSVVAGSKLGFVPKNAKTDRAICTEPLVNSVYQNAIGEVLTRKLRRVGCNLRDQTRNQQLALKGSITGALATIDLSAASDTISQAVVLDLLPPEWFELLDSTRSHHYTYEGGTYYFHKFSSMGNGFTFGLESLIFLALTLAVCEHLGLPKTAVQDVSVYGDDIIAPVEAVGLLTEVFSYYGFTINQDKSFSSGPFRESCGRDYFLGMYVRPMFIKKAFSNASIVSHANFLYGDDYYYDLPFKKLRSSLLKTLPSIIRKVLVGPVGKGDGHIHVPHRNRYIKTGHHAKRKRGWEGSPYYTVQVSPISRRVMGTGVYAAALYQQTGEYESTLSKPWNLILRDLIESGSKEPSSINGCMNAVTRKRVTYTLKRKYHPWYN